MTKGPFYVLSGVLFGLTVGLLLKIVLGWVV